MKNYRKLTEEEVLLLKSQSCIADNWDNVLVAEGFKTDYVHHTRFSGEVKLGLFEKEFTLRGGIKKHAGLRHVSLHGSIRSSSGRGGAGAMRGKMGRRAPARRVAGFTGQRRQIGRAHV